ncbi:MAG: hypothetical protein KBH14_18570 [Vicinamibacteria bacterium]|jgi:hypothetical protein|nr:hypothetical protein [Vicinamibacteria bacterium]MBP9948419.1 hypothetical protein [Vicinamibacteria bacterium]
MPQAPSLRPWVRITFLGWLLGIVLVVALALTGEMAGVHGSQIAVGLGMGLGVGVAQERALRPLLGPSQSWRWVSTFGLALPFLLVDIARLLGFQPPYSLYGAVAVAGVSAGIGQAALLRGRPVSAPLWVLASAIGWSAAAALVAAADTLTRESTLRGLPGALLYLGIVGAGGVVLGLVTSLPLRPLAEEVASEGR